MKKSYFIVSMIFSMLVLSCENSFNMIKPVTEEQRQSAMKKTVKVNRNVTGGFDLKPYIDVTMKNVDASDINIYDFEALLAEEYSFNGNRIKFNLEEKKVRFNLLSAEIRGQKYSNVSVCYGYTIKSASSNLLYMCPIDYKSVEIFAGGNKLNPQDFSPFAFYVSLYGFGLGRLEVSKHLNNESFVHGGTYWAKE